MFDSGVNRADGSLDEHTQSDVASILPGSVWPGATLKVCFCYYRMWMTDVMPKSQLSY